MNLPVYIPLTDEQNQRLDQLVHSQTWVALIQFMKNRQARHAEDAINKLEVEAINRMKECEDIIEELDMTYNPIVQAPPKELRPPELEDYMP